MKTDIQIAQEAELRPITEIAEKIGLAPDQLQDVLNNPRSCKLQV